MNTNKIRVAIVVVDKATKEKCYTRLARAEKVAEEIARINGSEFVEVGETYLADCFGARI